MAQSKQIRVIPGPKVILKQPKPQSQQLGFKEMKGFGGQDPDLLKHALEDVEPLQDMTTVLIRPKVVPLEDLTGWETESEYDICTVNGEVLYKVVEETDCCGRCVCGPLQPFNVYINTPDGRLVIQLMRLLTLGSYICSQFVQKVQVYFPPGRLVGTVERMRHLTLPKFEVRNMYGDLQFLVEGPYCTCSCCGEVDYDIYTADRAKAVGKISKTWSGVYREAFSKTEYFGIEFPVALDIDMKVVLLGAGFLVDHIYFDH